MIRIFKLFGLVLVLALVIGTGQMLVSQGTNQNLWQLFWLGLVIWLWGYIILIRSKDKEGSEDEKERARDAFSLEQQRQLERLKVAAISALVAITFFYSSISFIFKEDIFISIIVLLVTFLVSFNLQSEILRKKRKTSD